MKTASARIQIDRNGSDVPKTNLTPAEVQLLCFKRMAVCGKIPVTDVKETGEVKRSDKEEVVRLSLIYGKDLVEALFGKVNHRLPADFKSALLGPDAEPTPPAKELKE